jgi:hypothetical protein
LAAFGSMVSSQFHSSTRKSTRWIAFSLRSFWSALLPLSSGEAGEILSKGAQTKNPPAGQGSLEALF